MGIRKPPSAAIRAVRGKACDVALMPEVAGCFTTAALAVLAVIRDSGSEGCVHSVAEIAVLAGVSKSTVYKAIQLAYATGIIGRPEAPIINLQIGRWVDYGVAQWPSATGVGESG